MNEQERVDYVKGQLAEVHALAKRGATDSTVSSMMLCEIFVALCELAETFLTEAEKDV